jgi:hypothetical protein
VPRVDHPGASGTGGETPRCGYVRSTMARLCHSLTTRCNTVAVNRLGSTPSRFDLSLSFTCKSSDFRSGAEGIRTPDLRRAKAARWFAGAFWSLQNACTLPRFCVDAFPGISGDLPGLLHRPYGPQSHKIRQDRYSSILLKVTYASFVKPRLRSLVDRGSAVPVFLKRVGDSLLKRHRPTLC